jgi:hypothetical protein
MSTNRLKIDRNRSKNTPKTGKFTDFGSHKVKITGLKFQLCNIYLTVKGNVRA